jgi:uncharacterized membrane-anchored protein
MEVPKTTFASAAKRVWGDNKRNKLMGIISLILSFAVSISASIFGWKYVLGPAKKAYDEKTEKTWKEKVKYYGYYALYVLAIIVGFFIPPSLLVWFGLKRHYIYLS